MIHIYSIQELIMNIATDIPPSPEMPPETGINIKNNFFTDIILLIKVIIRFFHIAGPYWHSREKNKIRFWTLLLIVLTISQVFMPMWQNQWNADFFDAVENKAWGDFLTQVGILGAIMLSNMVITGSHLWFKRQIQVGWRIWLTDQLLKSWMNAGRQHQLNHLPGEHDNPDGRIAEDIRNAVEVAIDLIHSILYCLLLLIGFTQILWELSGIIEIEMASFIWEIPGHLVFVAIAYSALFSSLALWLAQPLVVVNKRRQESEAKFRFELGRARENSETIALLRGEANERRRFGSLLRGVAAICQIQNWTLTRVILFSSGYSVLSNAFPLLVAAPRYISGTITLGALMQTSQAFQQMIQALSWPVDNASRVADWRSSVERVLGLYDALVSLENYHIGNANRRIVLIPTERPILSLQNLCISMPDGRMILSCFNAEVHAGERILIQGDSEATVKLFKVIGGLWPWGNGVVELPGAATIFFLPQQPYVPKGNLRAIVSYPTPSHGIDDAELRAALERVGLNSLAGRLDEGGNWEQVLTVGELQRIAFARILLHKPQWIFLDEATDVFDPSEEEAMMRLLEQELPNSAILTIGFRATLDAYHPRRLLLGHNKTVLSDLPKSTHR